MSGMEQAERAHAMNAFAWHVLQEASEELVRGQGHPLALMVSRVAIGKGHSLVVAGADGFVVDGGAVYVSSEVGQYGLSALDGGLSEDDPQFVVRDVREVDAGQSAPRKSRCVRPQAVALLRGAARARKWW